MDDYMDRPFPFEQLDEEHIEQCRNWLATQRARLDQSKKTWEDQYLLHHPFDNQRRMHEIEATEFRIEMNEHEFAQFLARKAEENNPN